MSYPVTGSLVEIWYGNELVGWGQGFKLDVKADYQPVRVLGKIYPETFVLSFVTVTGGFTVADHRTISYLRKYLTDMGEARASSAPSGKLFKLVATSDVSGQQDAPQYAVEDVRIIDMTTESDISNNLLTSTITFIGKKATVIE